MKDHIESELTKYLIDTNYFNGFITGFFLTVFFLLILLYFAQKHPTASKIYSHIMFCDDYDK